MLFLILLLAFLAGALLVLALGGLLSAPREAVARRVDALARPVAPAPDGFPSLAEAELEGGWQARLWEPIRRRLARLGARLTPAGASERLRASLQRAGSPSGLGAAEFAGLRLVCGLACLLLTLPFCLSPSLPFLLRPGLRLLPPLLGVVMGLTLPDALLRQAVRKRQALIRRALPEMIDLLVVSVEAGMGLDGALAKVTERMHGPLALELTRARQEMRLGKARSQALKDMATRLEMGEVKTFAAALYQSEQLGTSIARVLRAQSGMARAARVQRVREQAARLPVTMLFPLVAFIFPAIFVVLLGPSLLRLMAALARTN